MKYTIVDNKGARFIGRNYDSAEEAEKKIEALREKFPNCHTLAVAGVGDDGNLHKPNKETKEVKEIKEHKGHKAS